MNKIHKNTCACCGYQTLPSNGLGEVCPVCFWEEGYEHHDDLFEFSAANYTTLYQAQENYKAFACCNKKMIAHCREPFNDEAKDPNWRSIQTIIEDTYDIEQLIIEIDKCCDYLIQIDSEIIFENFKSLCEIYLEQDHDKLEFEFSIDSKFEKYKHELKLKALSIALHKKNIEELIILFKKYYQKGLCYYISWTIMLIVLVNKKQCKFDVKMSNILLDIEYNNFYGLASLEAALKYYWHKNATS